MSRSVATCHMARADGGRRLVFPPRNDKIRTTVIPYNNQIDNKTAGGTLNRSIFALFVLAPAFTLFDWRTGPSHRITCRVPRQPVPQTAHRAPSGMDLGVASASLTGNPTFQGYHQPAYFTSLPSSAPSTIWQLTHNHRTAERCCCCRCIHMGYAVPGNSSCAPPESLSVCTLG